ncbi:glycosyltransferase family 2 protein [Gloeothece verrucosa]|uniref:glycosyltransferase family 2 protein n=1 Tax=Gloeothece verrucosa TaxID=2546359 RepID=UPI001FDFE630|nr:glycosyltransferase family A protein [Gloeothece verrucosa]
MPLVSVIIPAYNAEKFIKGTLRSVLSQTYKNIEVLVIDDGSQDKTQEIVQAFARQDKRVRLLQQANSGVAAARNLGIQHSKGEFIAPVDADDIWYPENIEKQVQCMLEGGASVGVVYSWSVDINENDQPIGSFRAAKIVGNVYSTLLCHNFLGNASCTMIRRSSLDKVGWYSDEFRKQNAQGCEDWDLYLRIAEFYEFKVVQEFLVGYRKLSESMSRNYHTMARSHELILKKVQENKPQIPQLFYRLSKSNLYIYFAAQSSKAGNQKIAKFWLKKAVKAELMTFLIRPELYKLLMQNLAVSSWEFLRLKTSESQPKVSKLMSKTKPLSFEEIQNNKISQAGVVAVNDMFHFVIKNAYTALTK